MAEVAILDAGSQFGKLIDRIIRKLNYSTDIFPLDTPIEKLRSYKALVISGGPDSVNASTAIKPNPKIFDLDIPILGICYGLQLMNYLAGGTVSKKLIREDGQIDIEIDMDSDLFKDMQRTQTVLLTHGDSIDRIASNYRVIATSPNSIAAIQHTTKKIYGVQFHPEVDLTTNGSQIFQNFLGNISKIKPTFTIDNRLDNLITDLRKQVADKKVLILVSGGVDSSICLGLLLCALPQDQVYALHIDHGFMRLNESNLVKDTFAKYGFDVKVINASNEFSNATTLINYKLTKELKNTINPEEKRKIIGDTFMKVTDKYLIDIGLTDFLLCQGTLRTDLIESASKMASSHADTIKTHHNDTEIVRQKREMGLIIEPLKDYHKNEVREIGRQLGLAEELIVRQPFPGPGLSIRILCCDKPYITDDFDQISLQLKEFFDNETNVILLPIRSVGIQGDCRSYSYSVAISGKPNWTKLFELAKLIPQRIHKVNRVVYIFRKDCKESIKQITPTYINEESVDQLRRADAKCNKILNDCDNGELIKKISQMPIVLLPISFEDDKDHRIRSNRSIVLRPIITFDFMTGLVPIPGRDIPEEILYEMVDKVLEDDTISCVMLDLTSKPPGTIEWE